jgi:hypothetical protein
LDGHTDDRTDGSLALFGDGLSLLNEFLAEHIFGRVDGRVDSRIDCRIDCLTYLVLSGIDGLADLFLHSLDSIADSIADSIGGRVNGSFALLLDCVGRGAGVLRGCRLGLRERRTEGFGRACLELDCVAAQPGEQRQRRWRRWRRR